MPRFRRVAAVVAIIVLAVEVVVPCMMAAGRNRLLFFPADQPRPEESLASLAAAGATVVQIARHDGRRLAAYDVIPPKMPADAPVVLFFHGNAGNIATRATLATTLARTAGVRVVMPDYSGYGGNAGSPSERELELDALAACDYLVAHGVPAKRIIVFGESIGGGPAIYVATKRQVAGVVVQSTLSSLSSMASRRFAWMPLAGWLVRGAFPNATRVATISAPLLIVHGTVDRVIPVAEGQALQQAARPGTELMRIDGADHNDLFDIAGPRYLRALGQRFRQWAPPASLAADALPPIDGFIARHHTMSDGTTMPYRLFVPADYDWTRQYPLVIWLHGAGAIGSDNVKQVRGDQVPGTHTWTQPANQSRYPAFVLVPQTNSAWARARPLPGTQPLDVVRAIIDSLSAEFSIDGKRVYVSGQSLGGAGTWALVTASPNPFAAAIVLCGAWGDVAAAPNAASMPLWVFQGDRDSPSIVATSRNMVAAIRRAGGTPRYTEYAGVGHDIWNRTFADSLLVDWLFAQHR